MTVTVVAHQHGIVDGLPYLITPIGGFDEFSVLIQQYGVAEVTFHDDIFH